MKKHAGAIRAKAAARPRLVSLESKAHTVETDMRGWQVIDIERREIGRVSNVYADDAEQKMRFFEVSAPGRSGFGEVYFLLPAEAIRLIKDSKVFVEQDGHRVAMSPLHDPYTRREPSWEDYYSYFGYLPYWASPRVSASEAVEE